jgi:RNA polymerase sigma factor (sigma-70 family)
MTSPDLTCWTLIQNAVVGNATARDRFARLYEPIVRAYLGNRWKQSTHSVDDAVQDVFVELFKPGGALGKVEADRDGGFRAYLYGIVRNVAMRHESLRPIANPLPSDHPDSDTSLAAAFDKAWATTLLREAARRQKDRAEDERSQQRVELLQMRFQRGMPIRDIAVEWNKDPAWLHHEYATAKEEFRTALHSVVAFHQPTATHGEIDRACGELIGLLG